MPGTKLPSSPDNGQVRVLLLEDSDWDAKIAMEALASGHGPPLLVERVSTLAAALVNLRTGTYAAVVSDLNVPDSAGIATILAVRAAARPQVAVLAVTGVNDIVTGQAAMAAGAQDYVEKHADALPGLRRATLFAIERQKLVLELENRNRDLVEFGHVMAHDLRAPLRAAVHRLQALQEDHAAQMPAEAVAELDLVQGRLRYLYVLTDEIISYASAGLQREPAVEVESAALVREAVAMLDPPQGLKIEIQAGLPHMRAHRGPLSTAFQNLIGNGIKYHDRPDGVVRVWSQDRDEFVEFVVEDDGPGIPLERRTQIFEPFVARDPNRPDSNGIGLAATRRAVEAQGGTITMEPCEPRGTRFRFTWPRDAARVPA